MVELAIADDPRNQRQLPAGWDLDRGNLLVLGIPGSGTSTTLASAALALAHSSSPEDLDLLVLDLGARDLAPLADLPHTAAYVGSGSGAREQQVRFLKFIRAELDRRRAVGGQHRRMVILVDGLGVLRDEYDDFEGLKLLDGFYRVYADGPEVGIWTAIATARAKGVPSAIEEVTTQRWLFRLADPYDYSSSGVPASSPRRRCRVGACWRNPSCTPTWPPRISRWQRPWLRSLGIGGTRRPRRRWWASCRLRSP